MTQPVMIDAIAARVIETMNPTTKTRLERDCQQFFKDKNTSFTTRLDHATLDHPQVRSMTIKVTSKKVSTIINLDGATIIDGRYVQLHQKLPDTVLQSLKGMTANDIVETELLADHRVSHTVTADRQIHLHKLPMVELSSITAAGNDRQPITQEEFLDGLDRIGIIEVDRVLARYLSRLTPNLHLVLAKIEGLKHGHAGEIANLAEYHAGESAVLSLENNKLDITLESAGGAVRYRNGLFTCYSKSLSISAQIVYRYCCHMPKSGRHHRRSRRGNVSVQEMRDHLKTFKYFI